MNSYKCIICGKIEYGSSFYARSKQQMCYLCFKKKYNIVAGKTIKAPLLIDYQDVEPDDLPDDNDYFLPFFDLDE